MRTRSPKSIPEWLLLLSLLVVGARPLVAQPGGRTFASADSARAPRTDTIRVPVLRVDTVRVPEPSAAPVVAPLPVNINGLLQAWYAAGSQGDQSFRIRRAELRLGGRASERLTWTLMVDVAKSLSTAKTFVDVNGQQVLKDESVNQNSRMLQDAQVSVALHRAVTIDVGQFRIPLSAEGVLSAARLETIERAQFLADKARGGGYGDMRDIGVMARGSTRRLDWFAGLFNGVGESQNQTDRNQQKVKIARVVTRPLLGATRVQLGASGAYSGKPHPDAPRRDRIGAEGLLARGPVSVRAEAMTGADGDVHRLGGFVHAAVRTARNVEVVARFDRWDPDTRRERTAAERIARDVVVGVNWGGVAAPGTRMQVNLVQHALSGHVTPVTRQLLVNLQASW